MSAAQERSARHDGTPPSRFAIERGVVSALAWRDAVRLVRERSRWLGLVAQPLLFWVIMGSGMAESFAVSGTGVDALTYFYPGVLGMLVLFTSIFSTMSVIEDRHSGFLQAVLAGPGSSASLVLGKAAGVTIIVVVQAVLFLLVAPLAGYPFGSIAWGALLAVLLLGNFALTCANFIFAWWLDSTHGYHALMGVVLMPLWIVSGAMFPAPSGWMGWVVTLNPMTYGVSGLRAALGGEAIGAPLGLCLVVLGGSCVVTFLGAVWMTARR
jgi:ABC-type polysaccharide/polyol phosphate export permease